MEENACPSFTSILKSFWEVGKGKSHSRLRGRTRMPKIRGDKKRPDAKSCLLILNGVGGSAPAEVGRVKRKGARKFRGS